jgi:predicted nucleic acid-binding protein
MSAVVIDANIAIALLAERPHTPSAEQRMIEWKRRRVRLFAPSLWTSEVISGLRKLVFAGKMDQESALQAIAKMEKWGVQIYLPDTDLNQRALVWAGKLEQMVAYDAQYLALAERLQADFYTADRKLFHRCQTLGVSFVKLVE